MHDQKIVYLVVTGLFVFAYTGLLIIGGLVWRGHAPEGHIIALVGLVGPTIGYIGGLLSDARRRPAPPLELVKLPDPEVPQKVEISGGQAGPGSEVEIVPGANPNAAEPIS